MITKKAAFVKMSGWSIGFNQSLIVNSEPSKRDSLQSSSQPDPYSEKIDGQIEANRKKQNFDLVSKKMRDNVYKLDVDDRASERSPFCKKDNLLNCIAYINQDLEMLGFPCLKFENGSCVADTLFFINRLHDILSLYHKTLAVKEDLETKNHRLSCETNHHQSTCSRLRREKSQLDKEIGQEKEKSRQINLKYKQVNSRLKAEREEVKRLLSVMQSRDVQHKHDNKKREREIISLKERLHQLLADKVPDRKVGMDLRNVLSSSEGRRATWKNNHAKLEEEMYQLVISNYEERHRELMMENEDLRDCLLSLQRQLSELLKSTTDASASTVKQPQSISMSTEVANAEESFPSPSTIKSFEEGFIQMPFEIVRKEIERMFKDTCDQIHHSVKELAVSSDDNYLSLGVKTADQHEDAKRNVTIDVSEVERLKKQISNYKAIIGQQEELIQQSLHSQSQSVETTFLHESQLLKEKENLSEQKKLFFEEKSAFEKERRAFTDAASCFFKERQASQAERAKALKEPQHNVSPVKEKYSKFKGESFHHSRQLPATPVFSPVKEPNGSLPSRSAKILSGDDNQSDSHSIVSTSMQCAKDAKMMTQDRETVNIPVPTVQNAPIIHFTPSRPVKQMQPSPLSPLSSSYAAAIAFPVNQPHAATKSDIHTDGIEEAASLASIRAARMRIRTASQQDGL